MTSTSVLFCFAFSRIAYLASYKSKFPDFISNSKFPDIEEIKISLTCVNPEGGDWMRGLGSGHYQPCGNRWNVGCVYVGRAAWNRV